MLKAKTNAKSSFNIKESKRLNSMTTEKPNIAEMKNIFFS